MIQAVLIALIAFLVYMGDTLGYSQYDRPICTGLLVGIVLGDVTQGLIIGASLELAFIGTVSIGAALPPDIYTGGILGTAFAITTGSGVESALALMLPIATFALIIKQFIYSVIRESFNGVADAYAEKGDDKGVARMHVLSTLTYPIMMSVLVGFCFYLGGPAVEALLNQIPAWVSKGFSAASAMLPALGFAMLVKMTVTKDLVPYFFAGFLIATYLKIPVIGIAAIALVIAYLVTNNHGTQLVEGGSDDDF